MLKAAVNKKTILQCLIKDKYLYILLVPGIIYFILFRYLPMGGLIISFKDYNIFDGIMNSPWVGFKNFQEILGSTDFWNILRNTLLISIYKIIFAFPVPIILSILLNEINKDKFKKFVQTVLYLPHFISWVVLGGIMLTILSPNYGIINRIISLLGKESINMLASGKYFRSILVISDIWKEAGWGMIIYLASITQIDPSLYEASYVDGANKWQRTRHITLPAITGVIVLLLILKIGQLMNAGFEQIMVLQNPVVRDISEIFDTYVYRVGLQNGRYSYTAAVDFFKSLVAMTLILSADFFAKRIGEEGLL